MNKAELLLKVVNEAVTDAEVAQFMREMKKGRSRSKPVKKFKKGDRVRILTVINTPRAVDGDTAKVLEQRGDRVAIQLDTTGEKGVVQTDQIEKASDIFIM